MTVTTLAHGHSLSLSPHYTQGGRGGGKSASLRDSPSERELPRGEIRFRSWKTRSQKALETRKGIILGVFSRSRSRGWVANAIMRRFDSNSRWRTVAGIWGIAPEEWKREKKNGTKDLSRERARESERPGSLIQRNAPGIKVIVVGVRDSVSRHWTGVDPSCAGVALLLLSSTSESPMSSHAPAPRGQSLATPARQRGFIVGRSCAPIPSRAKTSRGPRTRFSASSEKDEKRNLDSSFNLKTFELWCWILKCWVF